MAQKKAKRKKADGNVHQSIANAVAQLPELLHVEDAFAYPISPKAQQKVPAKPVAKETQKFLTPSLPKKTPTQAPTLRPSAAALSSRRKILWSGVTLMSVLIFTLWAINMRSVIHDVGDNPVPEWQLIATAQADTAAIIEKIAPTPTEKPPEPGTTDALMKALNSIIPQTTETKEGAPTIEPETAPTLPEPTDKKVITPSPNTP